MDAGSGTGRVRTKASTRPVSMLKPNPVTYIAKGLTEMSVANEVPKLPRKGWRSTAEADEPFHR